MTDSESTSCELLVVGGGLAGTMAALAAARTDETASVQLISPSTERFETHSGLLDVLGYTPGGEEPVSNPFATIDDLPEQHWYSKLGISTVREAVTLFDEITGEQYAGEARETNALFPTAVGRVTPAARYPASMAAGAVSYQQPIRLAGFEQLPDFDQALAAHRLDENLPYDVSATAITAPFSVDSVPAAPVFAEVLDENDVTETGKPARSELVSTLQDHLDVEPRIGLPAALGENDAKAIRAKIETELLVDVFEIPIGPPSIPGRRLKTTLDRALSDGGVSVARGVTPTTVETNSSRIERIETESGTVYEPESVVLATGGIQAGGVRSDRTSITEPLFDCPVSAPSDRTEWVSRSFLGDHEAVRIGVETDEELRPVDGSTPLYSNLHTAGQILQTTNLIAEQSTDGVALATGYDAGRLAIENL